MTGKVARSVFFVVVGLFLSSLGARADVYPSVEVICAPQIDHFSVTTKSLDPGDAESVSLKAGSVFVIRTLKDLRNNPLSCAWKTKAFKISVTGYHVPEDHGQCGGVEYGTIHIDWDGVPVALIKEDQCGESDQSVEVTQINSTLTIEQCVYSQFEGGDGSYVCKTHFFDLIKKKMNT